MKGSYQTRCEAAALSFNTKGDYYRIINKTATGKSPSHFTKRHTLRCKKQLAKYNVRRKLFTKKSGKKKQVVIPHEDYGPDANYIPLDVNSDEYKSKVKNFLELKKTPEEIQEIENGIVGQSANPKTGCKKDPFE